MARVSRTGRLNVVVTREGSLSPRSRSGSASPSRGSHHHIEQQLPQQRRAESLQKEVKVLRGYLSIGGDEARASRETAFSFSKTKEKCTELQQEKVKTAKRLLDASRLESARLSRLVEVKSRKLHAARKEARTIAARVPVLAAAVSRLREVTGNAESALGKEGKRAEEEQRRSEAWRARVDKLSLQARLDGGGAECCRILGAENHQLKEEIERVREHLEGAKRRCSAAGATSNALRLKTIESELLSEELGAVRADCGRLVQLVSSTKEYAEFRRLWDDSGGLTRPNNGGATHPFLAAKSGVSISHGVIANAATPREEEPTKSAASFGEAAPFSEGMQRTATEGPAAAHRGTPTTHSSDPWEQVMRSEWSSPSEKLIGAAAVAATPPPLPPPPPPPQSRPLSSASTQGEPTAGSGAASSAKERAAAERGSRPEGSPGRSAEPPPTTRKRVSFSGQAVAPPAAADVGGREVHHGVGRGLGGSSMSGTGLGTTTSAAGGGLVRGRRGGEDSDGGAEVVRWGRVDLLSVLYPPRPSTSPPGAGTAPSGTNPDPDTEASMWVPREAAGLCRRFVQDLDGYSGLPLDAEQHRRLWGLLLGLNACWRLSERRHVERLRTRYRAELAAAHRRLHMRKPLEEVVGERAAERRLPSRALTTSSTSAAAGTLAAKTAAGGHGRPPAQWGADGRRIRRGGEESGRRNGTACTTACSRNCVNSSSSSGRRQTDKAVGTRLKRTKGRGCRRATVRKGQQSSKVGGGDRLASSAVLRASNASAGAEGIDNVVRAAAPVESVGGERYAPDGAAAIAAVAAAAAVAEADADPDPYRSIDSGLHVARYRDFFDQFQDALLAEDGPHREAEETATNGQHARTTAEEGEEAHHRDEIPAYSGVSSSASPREANAESERRAGDERQKQGTGGRGVEGGGARRIEQQQRTSSGFGRRETPPPSTLAPFHTRTRLGHASLLPPAPPNIDS
ncbi:unnamed protein product [Ectocarpus fasciculatus]